MNIVTLKDVASQAGVSIATASLVINGKGSISSDVRDRVINKAKSLGYIKNIHAVSMVSKKSQHVAVLVDESHEKAFEWNLIRSILIPLESILTEHKYYPILIPVTRSQSVSQIVDKIVLSGAGSLFAIHFGSKELFRQLEDRGIPVIVLNHNRATQEFYSVTDDFIYGTFNATQFVLNKGHRNLVYIDYKRPDLPGVAFDRRIGVAKAIDHFEQSIELDEYTITDISNIAELEKSVLDIATKARKQMLAIIAHDDYLAAHVYTILLRQGLKIPSDISITSPGDTLDYTLPFIPQITTFRTDFELMGTLAGQMLLRRLTDECNSVESLKVQNTLNNRGSVLDL